MEYLLDGLVNALKLIFSLDQEVFSITFISIKISTSAILLSSLIGVPLGFLIGVNSFNGKGVLITLFNTLMAFPTLVVGLMVYSMISNKGPFGTFELLFTPVAMIIGQFILATPIVTALTIAAVQGVDPRIKKTALSLGANGFQSMLAIALESRFSIIAAVAAGFGRVIGEVGASMMLGGNIRGVTRNIPTAIALETSKGEFSIGLALGFILLTVALVVNCFIRFLQSKN